jgi:hypothetical protein
LLDFARARVSLEMIHAQSRLGFLPWQKSMEVLELERSNVAFVSNEDRNAEYFVETSAATLIQLVRSSIAPGAIACRGNRILTSEF